MERKTLEAIVEPYQFAFHDNVDNEPHYNTRITGLFKKLQLGIEISKEDKQYIFDITLTNNGVYKLGGWIYPFNEFMNLYWIKYGYGGGISERRAFNKTNFRASYYITNIIKIIEIQKSNY
jgi:hypothetical protein